MKKSKRERPCSNSSSISTGPMIQGVVTELQRGRISVRVDQTTLPCLLSKAFTEDKNSPAMKCSCAVGDQVRMEQTNPGEYRLREILPRTSAVYRGNRRAPGETILLAANVQLLLAVVPADYLLGQCGFWENAILAAHRAGIRVGLVVSRWDEVSESAQAALQRKLQLYQGTAFGLFTASNAAASEELLHAVRGQRVVVVGDRSAGKTTLVRRLLEGLGTDGPLPPSQSTSGAALYTADGDTTLIDTVGFRDFALANVTGEERAMVFPEIAQAAEHCSYRDCTHTHEEGCQVIEGVRAKTISRERYQLYQQMGGQSSGMAKRKDQPDYRRTGCAESFVCEVCGRLVTPEGAGTQHRNHCPYCLSSIHVDNEPGDRASLCHGVMEPIGVWVRKGGEWAILHRCRRCGTISSNRVAADDNPMKLMSIAVKPLSTPPFPLDRLEDVMASAGSHQPDESSQPGA